MKKKLTILLAALFLITAFAGCSSKNEETLSAHNGNHGTANTQGEEQTWCSSRYTRKPYFIFGGRQNSGRTESAALRKRWFIGVHIAAWIHAALGLIHNAGIDALARNGAMLHIFSQEECHLTVSGLNSLLNEQTALAEYTESVHSKDAIAGFMLILQNVFSGILLAFVLVLLFVVLIVLSHSIYSFTAFIPSVVEWEKQIYRSVFTF